MKYKIEIDGQTYQVEVGDLQARPVIAVVDGETFEVWPDEETRAAQPAQAAVEIAVPEVASSTIGQPPAATGGRGDVLSAPLPGVIVAILVQPGEAVTRGQELLTLEAMKMKNAIKSHRDGTIGSVAVNVGDQVAHGQTLMKFED